MIRTIFTLAQNIAKYHLSHLEDPEFHPLQSLKVVLKHSLVTESKQYNQTKSNSKPKDKPLLQH